MPASVARDLVFTLRPRTTNIGNDLIALGLREVLRRCWPVPADVVALPTAGVHGARQGGLDSRTVHEANLLAVAVLVGAGNLLENGALTVDDTALDALQVPLGLVAISSGRVYGRDGDLHARTDRSPAQRVLRLCERAEVVLVRDLATARALKELGVEDVTVAGCPSLWLRHALDEMPGPDPELAGAVLVSVRAPQLMSVPHLERGRVRRDLQWLVDEISKSHDRVVLLCHDFQDLGFAAEFEGVERRYTEDPRELVGWLRGCEAVVGYRLHGFLAGVALGIPAVHISYDERGESMVATLGLEAYDVPMLRTPDVAGAVVDRLRGLTGSPPGAAAAATLEGLERAMADGLARVASGVVAR